MTAVRERSIFRNLPILALFLLLAPGCITEPDTLDNDSTNTVVQIVQMQGQDVDAEGLGDVADDLFSDVCFSTDPLEGCSVFNDNGIVSMVAFPKDRSQLSTSELGVNSVQFERYRVTFIRADGRNVPGVDVPYPFDGVANFLVPVDGGEVDRSFVVVRHQAKVESPLREIQTDITKIISVIAQVDFYGRDGAGRSIQVTGYLSVTFADFANASTE